MKIRFLSITTLALESVTNPSDNHVHTFAKGETVKLEGITKLADGWVTLHLRGWEARCVRPSLYGVIS